MLIRTPDLAELAGPDSTAAPEPERWMSVETVYASFSDRTETPQGVYASNPKVCTRTKVVRDIAVQAAQEPKNDVQLSLVVDMSELSSDGSIVLSVCVKNKNNRGMHERLDSTDAEDNDYAAEIHRIICRNAVATETENHEMIKDAIKKAFSRIPGEWEDRCSWAKAHFPYLELSYKKQSVPDDAFYAAVMLHLLDLNEYPGFDYTSKISDATGSGSESVISVTLDGKRSAACLSFNNIKLLFLAIIEAKMGVKKPASVCGIPIGSRHCFCESKLLADCDRMHQKRLEFLLLCKDLFTPVNGESSWSNQFTRDRKRDWHDKASDHHYISWTIAQEVWPVIIGDYYYHEDPGVESQSVV